MKHLAICFLSVFLICAATADAPADDTVDLSAEQHDALLERAIAESAEEGSDCDDDALLSCLGIDANQCSTLLASVLGECTMPLARKILSSDEIAAGDIELEHAKCTFALGQRDYSIEPQRYMSCMPEGSFQNPQVIQEWLEDQQK